MRRTRLELQRDALKASRQTLVPLRGVGFDAILVRPCNKASSEWPSMDFVDVSLLCGLRSGGRRSCAQLSWSIVGRVDHKPRCISQSGMAAESIHDDARGTSDRRRWRAISLLTTDEDVLSVSICGMDFLWALSWP